VVVVHKEKEQEVRVTRELEEGENITWQMFAVHGQKVRMVRQETKDFLVDTINSYVKTGKIPEGRIEIVYTTTEFRHWICPHCGKKNTTERVEQGYPLPQCHYCEEQNDWGNQGGK